MAASTLGGGWGAAAAAVAAAFATACDGGGDLDALWRDGTGTDGSMAGLCRGGVVSACRTYATKRGRTPLCGEWAGAVAVVIGAAATASVNAAAPTAAADGTDGGGTGDASDAGCGAAAGVGDGARPTDDAGDSSHDGAPVAGDVPAAAAAGPRGGGGGDASTSSSRSSSRSLSLHDMADGAQRAARHAQPAGAQRSSVRTMQRSVAAAAPLLARRARRSGARGGSGV